MKYLISFALLALLANCGGPRVSAADVADSGVIGSWREENAVSIVYQKSSTSDQMLYAEATSACKAIGKTPGPRSEEPLHSAGKIPGVDGKVIYQCI